jgi:hypothetical protein
MLDGVARCMRPEEGELLDALAKAYRIVRMVAALPGEMEIVRVIGRRGPRRSASRTASPFPSVSDLAIW